MRHKILVLIFMIATSIANAYADNIESLLKELDRAILQNESYESKKKTEIDSIKAQLIQKNITDEQRYQVFNDLYEAYKSYISDSAIHYINLNLALAEKRERPDWLNESNIHLANMLATSGLFAESGNIMKQINREFLNKKNWVDYYAVYEELYLYLSEYTHDDPEYSQYYWQKRELYRDSVIQLAPEDSFLFFSSRGSQCLDSGYIEEAQKLLYQALQKTVPGTRGYSIATAVLAHSYWMQGDKEQSQKYLILSAISDIKAVVKENNSIRKLAQIMFEEGNIDRANRYVKESMRDANAFNARLRNLQASKMLPIIDRAYSEELEHQKKRLTIMLILVSSLSLGLIIAIILVFLQLHKLATARQALQDANLAQENLIKELNEKNLTIEHNNRELTEANAIKEEYIGRFLGQCSNYIEKLDLFRRTLNKLGSSNKIDNMIKMVKSSQLVEEELKAFYENFDSAFLKIYPNFVNQFNALMLPEYQIVPKKSEQLTTELRIFALIRLGFTDSAKISSMLRHSITTIYTYRSKTKNHAKEPELFEQNIQKIASL